MRRDCDTCRYFDTDFDHLPCSVCSRFSEWGEMTNADHIRSMTDEELAEFLHDAMLPHAYWLDWLKQPYKEDTNG